MKTVARHVAVIDVGKTNAKVVLHDLAERRDLAFRSTANEVRRDGPYPHFDLDGLFAFIVRSLGEVAEGHPLDAIAITTHGASIVLVDSEGLALPMLDYETDLAGPESDAYDALRPDFSETLSPGMGGGLNVGRQLYWLERRFPDAFARTRHMLTYPQYWAWRLSGVASVETTSLACHTDLWSPPRGTYSALVERAGWTSLLPQRRSAFDVLGPLRPEITERAGLLDRGAIPVLCGIHDSNASLLPHLLSRPAPFAVVSTGTWVVSFAIGGRSVPLDPGRGTFSNVNAFGDPVPSGIFMGGREFDLLTDHAPEKPSEETIADVIRRGIMALPGQTRGSGSLPEGLGGWSAEPSTLSPAERTAAASLYCALATQAVLALIGADGPTVVEGPFARNDLYLRALGQLTGRRVAAPLEGTGTSAGAALLALGPQATIERAAERPISESPLPDLADYRRAWLGVVHAPKQEVTA
ncbi:FGGY-family carbohydrate kinase [Aureimonas sp. SK2]|uniref:FGGY-family carbohydrate kinase n=1 Tax=Aureimonas sp. SK2 TaxID=3015992 RepID=UPI002443F702|nr:FGGY family carbohydrate kinase [Aureimonas sp. SK2]